MLLFSLCLLLSIINGNADHITVRGIQTSLLSMYIPTKPFTCLDGSLTIPFGFVNDDYCDCPDGTDEPGTSACPNGRFFCENKGHAGTLIPSYWVGDGVCDCCDGSDEFETKVICNNTCFELAQKSHAEHEAKRLLHETGVAKKKEIIAKSEHVKAEREARLNNLQRDLEKIEKELKEKEELKQQAEVPENAAKEKHNKLWEEKRVILEAIQRNKQMHEIFIDLDSNGDSLVSIDELQNHEELDTDKENGFTNDEVRTILGADTVDLEEFNATVFDQISNSYQKRSDSDTINKKDDETNYNEKSPSIATSLEHEKHIHDDTPPEYDEETKRLIQIADQYRNDYNEVQGRLLHIKNEIDDLKKQSNFDVGLQGEYSAFIDQCYDFDEREYTYRVCMFKDAKQISKGGGSDVTIGYWDKWTGPSNDKYSKMKYANGATCWNGPARSLTITFRCGTEHKIMDVREPNRCEYAMIFETPSACDEKVAATTSHSEHVEF